MAKKAVETGDFSEVSLWNLDLDDSLLDDDDGD